MLSVLEECDSTMFCANDTCACLPGHRRNAATGLCSGCGNGVLDADEECDGSAHCDNASCRCAEHYVPNTAAVGTCIASAHIPTPDHSPAVLIASSTIFAVGIFTLLFAFLVFQRFAVTLLLSCAPLSCCCSRIITT